MDALKNKQKRNQPNKTIIIPHLHALVWGEWQTHRQGWFQELLLDKKLSTLQKLKDPPEQCKVTTAMTSPKTRQ